MASREDLIARITAEILQTADVIRQQEKLDSVEVSARNDSLNLNVNETVG